MNATNADLTSLPDAELERWADDLALLADELTGEPRRAALADALACERELARRRSASVLLAAAA